VRGDRAFGDQQHTDDSVKDRNAWHAKEESEIVSRMRDGQTKLAQR
jgi:hypothetical protein